MAENDDGFGFAQSGLVVPSKGDEIPNPFKLFSEGSLGAALCTLGALTPLAALTEGSRCHVPFVTVLLIDCSRVP